MGIEGDSSQGIKRPRREADHSPPSSAEIMIGAAVPPLSHVSSRNNTYLIKHRDILPFYLLQTSAISIDFVVSVHVIQNKTELSQVA
jgi:hypothetical protein